MSDTFLRVSAAAAGYGALVTIIAALIHLPPWPWSIIPGAGLAGGLLIRYRFYESHRDAPQKQD